MTRLAIYMNEAGDSVVHHVGFSWLAALVAPVWALQRRLYVTSVVTLAINVFVNSVGALIADETVRAVVWLASFVALCLIFGFGANVFHRLVLERTGYFMTSAEPGALKGAS
jgi:hypothetical protein